MEYKKWISSAAVLLLALLSLVKEGTLEDGRCRGDLRKNWFTNVKEWTSSCTGPADYRPKQAGVAGLVTCSINPCAPPPTGMGITCYMCNSERNKRMCEHLEGDVSALEQDCDKLAIEGRRNVTYTVCRKMYQLIYNGGEKEIERVIRQCGTGGSLGCMKKTKPNSLQVETCHCKEDLCNAAPPYASWLGLGLSLVSSLLWTTAASLL